MAYLHALTDTDHKACKAQFFSSWTHLGFVWGFPPHNICLFFVRNGIKPDACMVPLAEIYSREISTFVRRGVLLIKVLIFI